MNTPHLTRCPRINASLLIGCVILCSAAYSMGQAAGKFNHPGNILITDQFNNRVIEIDPNGNIVWQFGNGPGDTAANAIVGTNDADRVGDLTLMSGTRIPPPAPPNSALTAYTPNPLLLIPPPPT